jgi:hypothetical protein
VCFKYNGKIAVYCTNHSKDVNALCGQNAEFFVLNIPVYIYIYIYIYLKRLRVKFGCFIFGSIVYVLL